MDISKQIVSTRKAKGFTQQMLADKANLALSTVKRIENGKVTPRIHTLSVLSEILEIDLLPKDFKHENSLQVTLLSVVLSFLPPTNIVYLLMSKSKDKTIINKLLFLQISSFILFVILLFVVPFITHLVTGQKIYAQINTPQILYMGFILFNFFAGLSIVKRSKMQKPPKSHH
ncbi:helix-turn-helix transcriptional regulator [uncultured Tenacibaculum sp.]|uniref:helix-turn-helix domain-containing protein n=1 Tax=uncultured Tenacibaculum sp. TaxID=174713 RepID=UPI00261BD0E2|nr:helix-turn-helix transcriptional regulator [uncultured Tenacibaculum sp.]